MGGGNRKGLWGKGRDEEGVDVERELMLRERE